MLSAWERLIECDCVYAIMDGTMIRLFASGRSIARMTFRAPSGYKSRIDISGYGRADLSEEQDRMAFASFEAERDRRKRLNKDEIVYELIGPPNE